MDKRMDRNRVESNYLKGSRDEKESSRDRFHTDRTDRDNNKKRKYNSTCRSEDEGDDTKSRNSDYHSARSSRFLSEREVRDKKCKHSKNSDNKIERKPDHHGSLNHRFERETNEIRNANLDHKTGRKSEKSTSVNPRLQMFCKLLTQERNRQVAHHIDDGKSRAVVVEAKMSLEGNLAVDKFSRGIKTDIISNRDLPYCCSECKKSFMMATQLQDHLQNAHNIIRHASLIKLSNKSNVEEDKDDDNDEDEF